MTVPPRRRPERASADDLMALASERGSTPMQVGAVLVLDTRSGLTPGVVERAIAERVVAVPRLRQRLVDVPLGCGRPVWVDDPEFAIGNHFGVVRCPEPAGPEGVLEVAAELLATPLPRSRPLWAAMLVTDAGQDSAALIMVIHHVLADGIGGLAVLANLVDGAARDLRPRSPAPTPSMRGLAVDAARERLASAARVVLALRRLRDGASALRPAFSRRLPRSSLNRPTGPRRQLAVVEVDLARVHDAARAQHATVNDVVVVAVAGALHRLLATRGEVVDELVISVPVSTRTHASADDLGNHSGVVPLRVGAVGDPLGRLEAVAGRSRAVRRARPGTSTAVLGPLFRLLAAVGLYRRFVDGQRLIHTFVSNVHGPDRTLGLVGCPITGIVPLSMAGGNVTVSFAVLSYAGRLAITVIADPDTCPELPLLRQTLEEELSSMCR